MARRRLRPEEVELWRRVTALVSPIEQGPRPSPDTGTPVAEPAPPPVRHPPASRRGASGPAARPQANPAAPPAPRIDGHLRRSLARGKQRPEARIDLHGMTLGQAHAALNHFILSSHAARRRMVLVITGKGSTEPDVHGWGGGRGALRRQVPVWLSTPPLAPVVLGATEAHRSHGGHGALYVVLRRG